MPELPEVENTVKGLREKVVGRTFKDVWTDTPKIVKSPKRFSDFKKIIAGKKIKNILRKGKNIIFELSGGFSLLIHQKLTGHLLVGYWNYNKKQNKWLPVKNGPLSDPMNLFVRVVFVLDKGLMIALSDLRKFAKIELQKELNLNIGPDVLKISKKEFLEAVQKRKGKIKQVLMDQSVVAGIGNIYSDEILWAAKIHPFTKASDLSEQDLSNILDKAKKILKYSIMLGGDSMSDFRLVTGEKGKYQTKHKAYQRTGKPCFSCGAKIKKVKIGARSAHFCSDCQKQ